MYVLGGMDGTPLSSVECFDPSTGQWSAVVPMNTMRFTHGVAVVDGKLYAVGGYTVSSVECFDPSTGVWSVVAPMSTTRRDLAVVALECPAE